MTTVLVSGASGYVGGRLISHFIAQNDISVVALSRSEKSACRIPQSEQVRNVIIDWDDAAQVAEICRDVSVVVHLAVANEAAANNEPERSFADAEIIIQNLLSGAIKNQVQRFIGVSTSKVYGKNLINRVTEDTPPAPLNAYAVNHLNIENKILERHRPDDMERTVFRLSNSLGAPANSSIPCWSLIANNFCQQAATERQIVLKSSGKDWRNFVAMHDVVEAIAMAATPSKGAFPEGVLNLGGPTSLPILELAHLVAEQCDKVCGYRPPIKTGPGETDNPPELVYEIRRLLDAGFTPANDIEGEISATLRLCQKLAEG